MEQKHSQNTPYYYCVIPSWEILEGQSRIQAYEVNFPVLFVLLQNCLIRIAPHSSEYAVFILSICIYVCSSQLYPTSITKPRIQHLILFPTENTFQSKPCKSMQIRFADVPRINVRNTEFPCSITF